MRIHLLAIGQRMPDWIEKGFKEYARRLPAHCSLELVEIPPGHRSKNSDVKRAIAEESNKMLSAIPRGAMVIALDECGRSWSTRQLSQQMDDWLQGGSDVALLIGGPDGLSDECKQKAEQVWSLSDLTLPHPLVRVVLAEQLYRAWTVLQGHPYHRE